MSEGMSRNQSGDDLSVDQTVNDEMVYSEEEKQVEGQASRGEDSEAEAEMEGSDVESSGAMSGVREETPEESGTPQESPAGTGKTPS